MRFRQRSTRTSLDGRAPRGSSPLIAAALGARCGATHPSAVGGRGTAVGGGSDPAAGRASAATSCAATTRARRAAPRCHAEIYAAWRGSPMHQMTRLPAGDRDRRARRGRSGSASARRFASRTTRRGSSSATARATSSSRRRSTASTATASRASSAAATARTSPASRSASRRARRELLSAGLVRLRDAQLPSQGLLGAGGRAARPARGRRLEARPASSATTRVPYFDALWGELARTGRARLPGRGRRSLAAARAALRVRGHRRGGAGGAARARARRARSRARRRRAAARERRSARGARARHHASCGATSAPAHFVEIGIGCEACHGGSREHVERSARAARLRAAQRVPAARGRRPRAASRRAPRRSTAPARAATRCCSRATRSPGRAACAAAGAPGGSSITSGEARDFLLGGCARQMACATCHDPHARGSARRARALATPAGNARVRRAATRSTPRPRRCARTPTTIRRAPAARCVACHMPRKNMGLGYALTRYHRIGSPDRRRARRARSAARVRALPRRQAASRRWSTTWSAWWGKRYDRARAARLYGDARRERAARDAGARQAARAGAGDGGAGRARVTRGAAAAIARQLANPFPLVRYYARRAVDTLRGAPVRRRSRPDRRRRSRRRRASCVPAAVPRTARARAAPPSTKTERGATPMRAIDLD